MLYQAELHPENRLVVALHRKIGKACQGFTVAGGRQLFQGGLRRINRFPREPRSVLDRITRFNGAADQFDVLASAFRDGLAQLFRDVGGGGLDGTDQG